jgi:PAS domain S-box-containing protein
MRLVPRGFQVTFAMTPDHARSAEELRRLMPDQLQEFAVVLLDRDGRIVGWLSGAERIFGYRAEEVIGKPVDMLFPPEDREVGMPVFERHVAAQDGRAEDDRWMLRKDGLRFWAAGSISPLRDHAGEMRGFAKVLRNRSDVKGQIEALEKRIAGLERADEKKNKFIATLAHELRTPLSSLMNAAHIMNLAAPPTQEAAFAASMVERQIEAMRRLVDDLADVTRVNVGKVTLKKRRLQLHEVVREAVDTCRPSLDARTHELKVLMSDSTMTVEGDAGRLRQVFINLLENAAKYTEHGGSVFVKSFIEGHEAVVKIEDTGVGISPETLPRIFDLFTQAEVAGDRGGLGIGLSVVKDLVALHGGTVQVRSDGLGKGSEFTVRLPLAPAE